MSISALSSNLITDLSQQVRQNPFQQIQREFKQLAGALQSGNLSDAQSAYSSIQQLLLGNQSSSNSSAGSNGSSTIEKAFAALGLALQSGDLSQINRPTMPFRRKRGVATGSRPTAGYSQTELTRGGATVPSRSNRTGAARSSPSRMNVCRSTPGKRSDTSIRATSAHSRCCIPGGCMRASAAPPSPSAWSMSPGRPTPASTDMGQRSGALASPRKSQLKKDSETSRLQPIHQIGQLIGYKKKERTRHLA
jgi:hypothetical protein